MRNWWISDTGEMTLKGTPAFVGADGTALANEVEANNYAQMTGEGFSIWYDDEGQPGDPANPIKLSDWFILRCLYTVPRAREDFFKVLPSLLPQEQTRLNRLVASAPRAITSVVSSEQDKLDRISDKLNNPVRGQVAPGLFIWG